MNRQLTLTAVLTVVTLIVWSAWFVFDLVSSPSRPNFNNRSVEPLNPNLRTEALR